MSDIETQNDPLDELRRELSVAPSPEFAAKVRAQIAREPKRRWAAVIVWSSVAAAATILLGVVTLRPAREAVVTKATAPTARVMAPEVPAITPMRAPASSSRPSVTSGPARRIARVQGARPTAARLEVLVPGDQRRALERLLKGLNDGRFDPAVLSFASADQLAELPAPAPIAVIPIEIPAIGGIDIKK